MTVFAYLRYQMVWFALSSFQLRYELKQPGRVR